MNIFHKRQGQVDVNFCYFYTDTIFQFRHLLADDALKLEVISSLESAAGSFSKFTAHRFKKHLTGTNQLELYRSDKTDRAFQFWKRDPLAILVSTEKIFISKLEYIHKNPAKWGLCTHPEEYRWSSAKFYREGIDEFNMLTHSGSNIVSVGEDTNR